MEKILVIDDEKGTLSMLRLLLGAYGYTVLTAESAEKGLDIFRKENPAVILTDIKMPGMDGIGLLRKIKEENHDAEVIMITGHGDIELAIQSLKFDAADFITKPINNDALEIALKRVNEKITLKAELRKYTENLERLVEEKSRKLIEAERLAAVGQTVAGLAHAVKNITGGLTGGMYVLEKGIELKNETYLSQGWDMIKGNVSKISTTAMDLLNYAKERQPEYRLCDANLPAQEVLDLMRPKAEENGIALKADLAAGLPQVWIDPEGIHRCLLNLVTNAIDACSDIGYTKARPEIILRSMKPSGWAVEYQVIDNGVGMDEETRNKVFHVFFTTKGSRGTGLGLMIAKKIVEEHQGVIDLSSQKERGSQFFVRLPEKEPPGK